MPELTTRELACLQYLDGLMEATGASIGKRIDPKSGRTHRGNAIIGNSVARRLMMTHGYTTYLSDLNAWRITAAGRIALKAAQASPLLLAPNVKRIGNK